MHLAVGDGDSFDEKVRHILDAHVDGFDGALARQPEHFWPQVHAAAGPEEQHHCAAGPVRADAKTHLVPGRVVFFVRRDFQCCEAIAVSNIALAPDGEDIAALFDVALGVAQFVAQPILARPRSFYFQLGQAGLVGSQLPPLHFLLGGLAVFVCNFHQPCRARTSHARSVQPTGLEARSHGVAKAVKSTPNPCVDLERPAGYQHAARADDSSAGLVGNLDGDGILVILVRVNRLGQ